MNRGDQVTYRDYLTREKRPGRITMITRTPPVIIQVQDAELGNHLWLMAHEINQAAGITDENHKPKGGPLIEIPHCTDCQVSMRPKVLRKPSRGYVCPKCGAEIEPKRQKQINLFERGTDGEA